MDFRDWTLASAAAAMRGGEISSVELTKALIAAKDARDGDIRAYLTFDEEGALKAAAEADAARAAGSSAPLLGIPVAIKDLINVAGQPCTCASRILEGYVSPYDATVVAKLKAAGAVCAGRVNMDEFAMGPRPRTPPSKSRATRMTSRESLAAHRAAAPPRSPAARRYARSARTPAARSASRRRSAASWASSRHTGASRAMA